MEDTYNGVKRTFPKKMPGATIAAKQRMKNTPKALYKLQPTDPMQNKRKKGSKTRRQKRAAAFEAKIAAKKARSAQEYGEDSEQSEDNMDVEETPEKSMEKEKNPEKNVKVQENPGKSMKKQKNFEKIRKKEKNPEKNMKKQKNFEKNMKKQGNPEKIMKKEEVSHIQIQENDEECMEEQETEEVREEMIEESDEEAEDESAIFRKEIADMPMAKVKELKEKLGIKLFNKAFFGESSKTNTAKKQTPENQGKNFGRENAKRPREMSSKRPVSKFKNVYANERLEKERFDPRFEDRCGEFDEFIHRSNYAFLDDIKLKERKMLEKEIQKTKLEDPEKAEKMKESLRRIKNREKAVAEKDRNQEVIRQLRHDNNARLRRGEKPIYLKRSEVKMRMMKNKFEDLKKTNRLDNYLARKAKKQNRKGDEAPI